MVKVKVLEYDIRKRKKKVVEKDIELPKPIPEPKGIKLEDIRKLIAYAKKQGWI